MLYAAKDVQAAEDRVSGLCIVRFARRRQRRAVLHLWTPEPGALGLRPGAAAPRARSRVGAHMWWTILSAGWLHGSALHILFNMMAMRQIGPPTADIYGGARTVIIYTVASACGFLLSSVAGYVMPPLPIVGGAPFTLGASAAFSDWSAR